MSNVQFSTFFMTFVFILFINKWYYISKESVIKLLYSEFNVFLVYLQPINRFFTQLVVCSVRVCPYTRNKYWLTFKPPTLLLLQIPQSNVYDFIRYINKLPLIQTRSSIYTVIFLYILLSRGVFLFDEELYCCTSAKYIAVIGSQCS